MTSRQVYGIQLILCGMIEFGVASLTKAKRRGIHLRV